MNATQIAKRLDIEYELEGVERRSIYRDIALLQDCGYDIVQTEDKRSGWYMNTHAFADWQIMIDAVQQARCVSLNEQRFKVIINREYVCENTYSLLHTKY